MSERQPEDSHHITRQCSKIKCDGKRILPDFFKLRPEDNGKLSCNWCEYHVCNKPEWNLYSNCDMRKVLQDIEKKRKVGKSQFLPILQIKTIKDIFDRYGHSIRVVHMGEDSSYSHMLGIPDFFESPDDLHRLQEIVDEITKTCEIYSVQDIRGNKA